MTSSVTAQITTYPWPSDAGISDTYRVFIRLGGAPEQEVQVLISHASSKGDYRAKELEGRTFSFVPLSYGPSAGALMIRAVKLFGDGASSVSVHPRSYGITTTSASDGREAVFTVSAASRYFSVHFDGADNRTPADRWIKHMLCIFIDPLETDIPDRTAAGVVVYAPDISSDVLKAARTIYFPPGLHNLRNYGRGGIINDDGQLMLQEGQALYLAGGAFVEGIIGNAAERQPGQRVYGRGVLSGRRYLWKDNPDHRGPEYGQILKIGNKGRVEGITVCDSPHHGIVGGTTSIANLKFFGWHCNNDGIRVGKGSTVFNSFIRAVDDHFYNFNIHVSNVVLWAGHNGAILTYGWGGAATYNAGASLLEDIDIIHPEWTQLGNNNGLVASQVNLDYRPYGYGGRTTTVLKNIRIEGTVPGLLNLKPLTKAGGELNANPVAADKVGYLGDLRIENVTVDAQKGKSRIRGAANASRDGSKTFYIQNISCSNLRIGTTSITAETSVAFFDIETGTVKDIIFSER